MVKCHMQDREPVTLNQGADRLIRFTCVFLSVCLQPCIFLIGGRAQIEKETSGDTEKRKRLKSPYKQVHNCVCWLKR